MGRYRPKRTHVKNKTQSKARKTKYRSKDIDELQDAVLRGEQQRERDPDLPGMGQWTCLHCGRFFINKATLELHFASKIHKKQAKLVREERYSQLDAELAAGLGRPDNGKPRAAVAVADETKDVSM